MATRLMWTPPTYDLTHGPLGTIPWPADIAAVAVANGLSIAWHTPTSQYVVTDGKGNALNGAGDFVPAATAVPLFGVVGSDGDIRTVQVPLVDHCKAKGLL